MVGKNVQEYLEKGLTGTPQLKPDERRYYLGNFKERVYAWIGLEEIKQDPCLDKLKKEFEQDSDGRLFLNSKLSDRVQGDYIKVAQEFNKQFTIVNTDDPDNDTSIGLVYATSHLVEPAAVNLVQKYPSSAPKKSSDRKKTSFLSKFFRSQR